MTFTRLTLPASGTDVTADVLNVRASLNSAAQLPIAAPTGILVRRPAGNSGGLKTNSRDILGIIWAGIYYNLNDFFNFAASIGLSFNRTIAILPGLPIIVCETQRGTSGLTNGVQIGPDVTGVGSFSVTLFALQGPPTQAYLPSGNVLISFSFALTSDFPAASDFSPTLVPTLMGTPIAPSGLTIQRKILAPYPAIITFEIVVNAVADSGEMSLGPTRATVIYDAQQSSPNDAVVLPSNGVIIPAILDGSLIVGVNSVSPDPTATITLFDTRLALMPFGV